MTLSSLYLLSKKIHRWSLLVVMLLTVLMAGTGLLLKYPGLNDLLNTKMGLVRYIHREMSTWFTIDLGIMTVTGLAMYFIPEIIKNRTQKSTPPPV